MTKHHPSAAVVRYSKRNGRGENHNRVELAIILIGARRGE